MDTSGTKGNGVADASREATNAPVVLSSVWSREVAASPALTAAMFRTDGDRVHDAGAVSAAAAGVRVTLPGVLGLLILRADPTRTNLAAACSDTLGLVLPDNLGSAVSEPYCLRWLSPDEWLLSCPLADSLDVETRLRGALDGPFAITNVSGGYAVLELAGQAARQVLAKSTPLDVDPRVFGAGRVAGTVFAKTTVTLRRVDDDRYELVCRRSFADYVARWIAHAAAEYGLSVSEA